MQAIPVAADDAGVDPGPGWQWRFWSIFGGQALSMIGSALTQFVLMGGVGTLVSALAFLSSTLRNAD